jgi:hypothetical protein
MNKTYTFSCKGACSNEPITTRLASSLNEAIQYFASIKRLPVSQFLQLYEVKEK